MNESPSPTVSVLIPAYNSRATVVQAIESVWQQSVSLQCEVIVVDDGSTDGTRELLADFAKEGRITYLYQENQGCGKARNAGAKIARGAYLAFLDADDYWHPRKVELQLEAFAAHPGATICFTEAMLLDPARTVLGSSRELGYPVPRSGSLLPRLAFRNPITLSSTVVRTSDFVAVGGFEESYSLMSTEDFDLWLKLSRVGEAVFIPQALTYYEMRPPADPEQIARNHARMASILCTRMKDVPLYKRIPYATGWLFHTLYSLHEKNIRKT